MSENGSAIIKRESRICRGGRSGSSGSFRDGQETHIKCDNGLTKFLKHLRPVSPVYHHYRGPLEYAETNKASEGDSFCTCSAANT